MPITITGLDAVTLSMQAAAGAAADLGHARAQITASAPYARFVHDGTRPHRIVPRTRRALAWPGADHPVRAVNHPGYRGNPFLTDALTNRGPEVARLVSNAMGDVLHGGPTELVDEAFYAGAVLIQEDARARANSRTGTLRQSITAAVFGR